MMSLAYLTCHHWNVIFLWILPRNLNQVTQPGNKGQFQECSMISLQAHAITRDICSTRNTVRQNVQQELFLGTCCL